MKNSVFKYVVLLTGILAFSACGKNENGKDENQRIQKPTTTQGNRAQNQDPNARLQNVEAQLVKMAQDLAALKKKGSPSKDDVETLKDSLAELQKQIARLKAETTRRGDFEKFAADVSTSLESLQTGINKLKKRVQKLETPPSDTSIESVEPSVDEMTGIKSEIAELRKSVEELFLQVKAKKNEEQIEVESKKELTVDQALLNFALARKAGDVEKGQAMLEALVKMGIPSTEVELAKLDENDKLVKPEVTEVIKALELVKADLDKHMKSDEFKNLEGDIKKTAQKELEIVLARLKKLKP